MAPAVHVAADELATLVPAPKMVTVAGRAIHITEPTLRQVALYEQLAATLWALGDQAFPDDALLMEEHPAEADAMLLSVIDVDPAWLAGLHPLRKSELLSVWMETNADFLRDRLLQKRRLIAAATAMYGDGPTLSPASPTTELPNPKGARSAPRVSSVPPSTGPNGASESPG